MIYFSNVGAAQETKSIFSRKHILSLRDSFTPYNLLLIQVFPHCTNDSTDEMKQKLTFMLANTVTILTGKWVYNIYPRIHGY